MPDKITVGNCEIVSLLDVGMEMPYAMFFPDVPLAELESYRDLYPSCFGKAGFATDAGCYAVRSGGKTILVDTGIGPGPVDFLGGIEGKLLDDMRAKGVRAEDVDVVVHTHLHPDHVGWNLSADGKATFPRATYYAPQADMEFFEANPAMNPVFGAQVTPLRDLGCLETYSGEITVTPEVTTMPTPGHTPGHHSVIVNSGGEKLVITGDLAHHPAQVDRTEWCSAFDTDKAAATATRRKVLDELESEGTLSAFCHFPGSGFGRIGREGNRRVFQAL